MRISRRGVLPVSMGAACFTYADFATAEPISQLSVGQQRETQSVFDSARQLLGPQTAAVGERNTTDLARVVDKAIGDSGANEDQLNFAQRAGLLLYELNRNKRDGVDFTPSDAEPASVRYTLAPEIKADYASRFRVAKLDSSKAAELGRAAAFIKASRNRYTEVESDTGVPWYIVGALHYREASLNFMGHLHNGDPLLMQTTQVPAKRPPRPWPPDGVIDVRQLWRISAKDALGQFSRIVNNASDWTFQKLCFSFESYNGFGCRSHRIASPYLWNYTDQYKGGGFPRDHVFDPNYRSKQAGVISILLALKRLDVDVSIRIEA